MRTAVVLAAGNGSRMNAKVAKQFLELAGRPLIYYALKAVEDSKIIDQCVLVTGREDIARMQEDIVKKYHFQKVKAIIPGGSERCFSVANAMRWLAENDAGDLTRGEADKKGYVFIHDGARPFLTEEILERTYEAAVQCGACVAAMPSKDTVKLADENEFAALTPDRKRVWTIQTPQVFEKDLIVSAYERFENAVREWKEAGCRQDGPMVTDDASVVETYTDCKVKLVEGGYSNIKVTTPEDLVIAEALCCLLNQTL